MQRHRRGPSSSPREVGVEALWHAAGGEAQHGVPRQVDGIQLHMRQAGEGGGGGGVGGVGLGRGRARATQDGVHQGAGACAAAPPRVEWAVCWARAAPCMPACTWAPSGMETCRGPGSC